MSNWLCAPDAYSCCDSVRPWPSATCMLIRYWRSGDRERIAERAVRVGDGVNVPSASSTGSYRYCVRTILAMKS